jgi:hypothetical protein
MALPAIFLLLNVFSLCLATHAATYNITGANANLHHCRDSRDARNLIVSPSLPPAREIAIFYDRHTASMAKRWRFDTPIKYTIELPYLAFDARYRVQFDTENAQSANFSNVNRCSTEILHVKESPKGAGVLIEPSDWSDDGEPHVDVNTSTLVRPNEWNHLPNAAYPNALGDKKYGAYYVSEVSAWSIQKDAHLECSIIKYVASLSLKDLHECNALAITSLANDTIRVASNTLDIAIVTPESNKYGATKIHTHAYWDKYDNGVIVSVINGVSFASPTVVLSATVGSLGIVKNDDNRFEFILMVRTHAALHKDSFSFHAGSTSAMELLSVERAVKSSDGTFLHRLFVASNTTASIIEEVVVIDVRTHAHVHKSDVCMIVAQISVANPRVLEKQKTKTGTAPLLTNQVVFDDGRNVIEEEIKVVDGSRVCMINHVVMANDIEQVVGVRLVEAWLCVVAKGETESKKMQCANQRHTINLLKDGVPNESLNVSIVSPGRLGRSSVELCFSSSLEITDENELTLTAPTQRYESRIELVSRVGAGHGEKTIFESLGEIGETDLHAHNTIVRADSTQESAFSPFHIQSVVKRLSKEHVEVHVRSLSFDIAPAIGTTHNLSSFSSNFVLILVFFMFFCVVGIYCLLSSVDVSYYLRSPSFAEYYKK